MIVKVKLFAVYRDRAGVSDSHMELPAGSTVAQALMEFLRRYPAVSTSPEDLVTAVNQEYVDHEEVLKDGDELALIPPVSGGQAATVPRGFGYRPSSIRWRC